MGGPNLEIFKFAAYLFFPIAFMYHFGDPDWYDKHIEPAKSTFWPKEEDTNVGHSGHPYIYKAPADKPLKKPAKDPQSLKAQLEELKSKRKTSSHTAQSEQAQPQRLV